MAEQKTTPSHVHSSNCSHKVLFVVTSHNKIAHHPTGLWLEEFTVPYMDLLKHDIEIVVASPQGGIVPLDPKSAPEPQKATDWKKAIDALTHATKLEDVRADDFEAIFLPGGHGPMFDLATNRHLKELLSEFEAHSKVIGAICHGPAGLLNVKTKKGEKLLAGKTVTAFSAEEEAQGHLEKEVPFMLEDKIREEGATFRKGKPESGHVEVDGLLVTGQNPASVSDFSRRFCQLILESQTGGKHAGRQGLKKEHEPKHELKKEHEPKHEIKKEHEPKHEDKIKYAFIATIKSDPAAEEVRKELRVKHLEYLQQHRDIIAFGGPTLSPDGLPHTMIAILNTSDENEAKKFANNEPYYASNKVFDHISIAPFKQIMPEETEGSIQHRIEADAQKTKHQ